MAKDIESRFPDICAETAGNAKIKITRSLRVDFRVESL